MKTKYGAQKTAIIILLLSLPVSAQFAPIPTVELHHVSPKQEVSWHQKLNMYVYGGLVTKYSPNSKLLVTALPFHDTIKVYDPTTGKLTWKLKLGVNTPEHIDFDLNPSFKKYLDLVEAPLHKSLGHYNAHITAVEFSPDNSKIVIASFRALDKSGETLIVDALTGTLNTNLVTAGHVDRASFSPDGKLLVTASSKNNEDNPAKLWDTTTGDLLATLDILNGQGNTPSHVKNVSSVVFNKSGTHFYTLSHHGNILIWNAKDGSLLKRLNQTQNISFALSPHDGSILTNSNSNTALLYDANSGVLITSFSHSDSLWNLLLPSSFSADGQRIMTASSDGSVKIWQPDGNLLMTIQTKGVLKSAGFSPDGLRIITQEEKYAQIWDANTGSLIIDFGNLPTPILEAPPKSTLALFSNDGTQVLLTSGTKAQIWVLPPSVFMNDNALADTKNSLSLGSLKAMLLSYLPYLHINKKPSLKEFTEKYPEAQRALLVNLLKDMSFLHKDVGAYLFALFPELKR